MKNSKLLLKLFSVSIFILPAFGANAQSSTNGIDTVATPCGAAFNPIFSATSCSVSFFNTSTSKGGTPQYTWDFINLNIATPSTPMINYFKATTDASYYVIFVPLDS